MMCALDSAKHVAATFQFCDTGKLDRGAGQHRDAFILRSPIQDSRKRHQADGTSVVLWNIFGG